MTNSPANSLSYLEVDDAIFKVGRLYSGTADFLGEELQARDWKEE